ncbi:helix-turn-helix domain-containing protein [Leucobacter chromiireducens]|uniref:helix-turn-helix domain-containing protein n=1 Tax=Leucobacter chromiireducens TaxID=283877 RepID=UPI001925E7BB
MQQRELDEVVSLVSESTGRNVSLDDVAGRVVAYSTIVPTTDRVRIDAVLSKSVPSHAKIWESKHGISTRTRPFTVPGDPEHGLLPRICIPLLVRGVRVGYLWVQANSAEDTLAPLLAELEQRHSETERLAERVLLALGTPSGIASAANRDFQDLVSGQGDVVHEELAERMRPDRDTHLIVFSSAAAQKNAETLPALAYAHALQDAARAVYAAASPLESPEVVGFSTDQHGVFLIPNRSLIGPFAERLSIALELRTSARQEREVAYGVSAPISEASELRLAYRQAVTALQASVVDPALTTHRFDNVGIYRLLAHAATAHVPERIQRIANAPEGEERLRILERVYDSPGTMQRVADALHMHRTSIYNHLQRIAAIIDADPLDPLVRLELHAGLKLRRWLDRPRFEAPLGTRSAPQVF